MKKLFYGPLILVLSISCSHQNFKNEKAEGPFFMSRIPTSEASCMDYLKPFINFGSSTTSSSAKVWHDLNTSIMEEFTNKLTVKNAITYDFIYKKTMPHVQVLERIFDIRVGEKPTQNVGTILASYNKYMSDLVTKKLIKKEDILSPAFVFKTNDGAHVWKQFGEELPEGAMLEGNVLPDDVFNKMVREGFFPIGNADMTTTNISAFEHDLAHFTGFIESPEYMKAIKKLALADRDNLTEYQVKRAYFFNEGFIGIRDDKALMNALKLSDEMKKNPSKVTSEEMIKYLNGFSAEQLEATRIDLLRNMDAYVSMLGGAGRDPVSGVNNAFHDYMRILKPMLSMSVETPDDYVVVVSHQGLAAMQMILLRLRDVKMDDWVYATTHAVSKESPVYKLFIEKRIWAEVGPNGFGQDSQILDLRKVFLNDEMGTIDTEL